MAGKQKRAPSIVDVARRAGVSISTISRAMNDRTRLNPQTYERVQAAIRELNYRKARRGPAPARTRTVAVVVPSILDPYFSVALHGIDNVASTYNFNTLFFDSCNSTEIEVKTVNRIVGSGVDGVVLVPAGNSPEGYRLLLDAGIPVVLLDRTVEADDLRYVISNDEEGAYLAVKYLIDLGHHEILYFGGDRNTSTEQARLRGYRRAMRGRGLHVDKQSVIECSFDSERAYDAMNALLRGNHQPFSAVFAGNDLIAFGAMKALQESGLKVPRDVSIVGYGDMPFASMISLTSVSCPVLEMSKSAMTLLLHLVDRRFISSPRIVMRPALVLRSSCSRSSSVRESSAESGAAS
jgi:DNA-binding LacI/PurR family transcriptional regulator